MKDPGVGPSLSPKGRKRESGLKLWVEIQFISLNLHKWFPFSKPKSTIWSLLLKILLVNYIASLLFLPPYRIFSTQRPVIPLKFQIFWSKSPPWNEDGVRRQDSCRDSSRRRQSFLTTLKNLVWKRLDSKCIHLHMKFYHYFTVNYDKRHPSIY